MILAALLMVVFQPEEPYRVAAKMPDVMVPSSPSRVKLGGYIGNRIRLSEENRLCDVDLKPLLAGFHHQPGSHPWIGEHIGKWIHASTLAWANTGDPKLKRKLDAAVFELIQCQQKDGYLGTYTPDKRFGLFEGADWDVWTHKYDLLGLLTYYRFTGNQSALQCSARIGDLLINTFGEGKRSIRSAGTHMGMASTSVLEPIVLLYRASGNKKYLDFAKTIVKSWNEKDGPRIISTLQEGRPIDQVGNGKAYEMLSNLVGLCELARATGDAQYLDSAKRAWDDVVKHELYITGTASYYEHFHSGNDLPNQMGKNVGETCVTVTWMQLSQQLLRLTGNVKYADELERSAYNHLAGAQRPDGSAWCYYTSLDGTKPFTTETCCCLSSGPRGLAILPETSYMLREWRGEPCIVVNTFETSQASFQVNGRLVTINQTSDFPIRGRSMIRIASEKWQKIGVMIRNPKWATGVEVSGSLKYTISSAPDEARNYSEFSDWFFIAPKTWASKKVEMTYGIHPALIIGSGINTGHVAWTYGPFVLAYNAQLGGISAKAEKIWPTTDKQPLHFQVPVVRYGQALNLSLVPFADIGAKGERYKVWLPTASSGATSLFSGATESRSQSGNADGSIVDDDPGTYAVTFNGKPQDEAWFSVTVSTPVEIQRITFTQGPLFHDGGWFDTSKGKPIVQVQTVPNGPWITVGSLDYYPSTTASSHAGLRGGEQFTFALPAKQKVVGICVSGTPAGGDNPNQAFASCAELQAFRP